LKALGLLDDVDEVVSNGVKLDLASSRPLPDAASAMLSIRKNGGVNTSTGLKKRMPRNVISRLTRRHESTLLSRSIKKISIDPSLAQISAKVSKSGSVYAILGSRQEVNGSVEVDGYMAVELLQRRTYGKEDLLSAQLEKNIADVSDLASLLNVSVLGCLVGSMNADPVSPVDLMIALKLGEACFSDDIIVLR
jgi:hypothetical protein